MRESAPGPDAPRTLAKPSPTAPDLTSYWYKNLGRRCPLTKRQRRPLTHTDPREPGRGCQEVGTDRGSGRSGSVGPLSPRPLIKTWRVLKPEPPANPLLGSGSAF